MGYAFNCCDVIHGKTSKISDETVKRVQQELEQTGHIPNMAGIFFAFYIPVVLIFAFKKN